MTRRERQVLALLASGGSYATIAIQLRVSPATVKFHCGNLYRKLGVSGRLQAVQAAPLPAASGANTPCP